MYFDFVNHTQFQAMEAAKAKAKAEEEAKILAQKRADEEAARARAEEEAKILAQKRANEEAARARAEAEARALEAQRRVEAEQVIFIFVEPLRIHSFFVIDGFCSCLEGSCVERATLSSIT